MGILRWLFGRRAPPAPSDGIHKRSIIERARRFDDIRFVGSVLDDFDRTGTVSEKQLAALTRIVEEEEAAETAPRTYLGSVGSTIEVQGEVAHVQYSGRGKSRRARYVIFTDKGPAVFSGPAMLAGRLAVVRFKARVAAQVDGDTIVEDPTDIEILVRPSDRYQKAP